MPTFFTFESVGNILDTSGIGKASFCLVALVGCILKKGLDGIVIVRVVRFRVEVSGGSLVDEFGSAVSFDSLLVPFIKIEAISKTTLDASGDDAP